MQGREWNALRREENARKVVVCIERGRECKEGRGMH